MRVTNSLFYTNSVNNYQRTMQELYKTNAQISSGLKIQNSFEDSGVYVDTMRLNYEVATLEQVKESSSKAQTYANNTDKVLNQFTDALSKFKTKLIQSASSSNSNTSLDALANELQSLRDHMVSLGNTSINGQYLFSGTSFTSKPISADGTYNGNDGSMDAIIGSGVKLPYNITGEDLFLGQDSDFQRVLSTNVKMYNQTKLHPEVMSEGGELSQEVFLKESDTIRDMVGDKDTDPTNDADTIFYLSGRKPDGTTFKTNFSTSSISKVSDLLERIGQEFGNTTTNQVVDVNMNEHGQIEIKDIKNGNSMLEMNLFAAVDRDGAGNATQAGAAVNVNFAVNAGTTTQDLMTDIENNFGNVSVRIEDGQIYVSDTSGTTSSSFDISLTSQDTVAGTNINSFMTPDSMNYERRGFEKDGNNISSNISQMVKSTNEYATERTKLSEVSGASLNTKQFVLSGIDNSGNIFNAQIDFGNPTSTFSLDGGTTNYTIFDAVGGTTAENDMTYRQLSDVISMVVSGNIPATTGTFSDYENAVSSSKGAVEVGLDYKGRLEIHDKFNSKSPIEFSLFDGNADSSSNASTLTFMANDAVKIEDPNIDFFKDLDNMIEAVRKGTFRMDSESDDPRNIGIQNSLGRIDHIMTHVTKEHTKIGSYSNALSQANERSELLSINVQTVRSDVIDVDIGEAYMKFNQLSNSYQAMLSTVAKINSMSLLNYM